MNKAGHLPISLLVLFSGFALFSCATTADYDFSSIDASLKNADYEAVYSELEADSKRLYSKNDIVLENLDKGIVSHYAGNSKRSNEELSLAERKIDEFYAKSISQAVASFLVNDTVKDYAGSTYENIYTNIFMSLNYLKMNKFDDAFVEIRRFNNKLQEIISQNQVAIAKAKQSLAENNGELPDSDIKFHNSAFARYISMLIYRADGDSDNAGVDLKLLKEAFDLQPDLYDFSLPSSVNSELDVPPKMARLNVISFSGLSPVKTENNFRLFLGDTYYKLSLPEMQKRTSGVAGAKIFVESKAVSQKTEGSLEKIESIENIALDTYKQEYAMLFARSLLRSISKATMTGVLKNQSEKYDGAAGLALSLLSFASSISTEVTERADVRTGRFFPASVYVAGLTLEPGIYDIKIVYYNGNGSPVSEHNISDYQIGAEKLNLIESFCLK